MPSPIAISATPLPSLGEPMIINYSDPNLTKILAVGMSPNPLKVGETPQFSITYKNTSNRPIYGFAGCSGNPDLKYTISPTSKLENIYFISCQRADFGDVIEPNQTVIDIPSSVYVYKIIEPGIFHVTLTLTLSLNETTFLHEINDTIQFDVNAVQ